MKTIKQAISLALAAPLLFLGDNAQAGEFSAADVYRASSNAVVLIFASGSRQSGRMGTGSIISAEGLILTNSHVISDRSTGWPYDSIVVYLKPERITGDTRVDLQRGLRARVVVHDAEVDLALLELNHIPANLPVMPIGSSEDVEIGQSVAAIGHPGGGGMWTLTTGTISSIRKDGDRDVFQTDTAINPGNSGGPLIDAQATLIGVNTFVRRRNAQGLALEGLNYSIRSRVVLEWLNRNGFGQAPLLAASTSTAPRATQPPAAASKPPTTMPMPPTSRSETSTAMGAAGTSSKRPASTRARPATGGPEPRRFRGANGEKMFGVPDLDFDLAEAKKEIYERTKARASDAFDELDGSDPDDFDL